MQKLLELKTEKQLSKCIKELEKINKIDKPIANVTNKKEDTT